MINTDCVEMKKQDQVLDQACYQVRQKVWGQLNQVYWQVYFQISKRVWLKVWHD